MKLRYRSAARSDITRIFDYLDGQSPQARQMLEIVLKAALERLLQFPFAGTPTTRPGTRRLVVPPYPYAIFYRATTDAIIVIAVRHTARRPSQAFPH
ncbi:type II toxin-antitoxin system RelE/ParE family toxin [Bosea sp. (in: a-proteobacteria)]|uniref:type II toxin-antitoxin system RelE/ParE family toxin n=1 Tax=Bosea sp. (in: a-proteobacteria) TaxID=1871050 RepID=UPI002732C8AD|nr:type II toxin-antitoxin system RelE/ParE family toxin [Bosea sp. (in: a-proteobacteria)]